MGDDFYHKIQKGLEFDNYPLVFSEACQCGKYSGQLTRCFIKALALYIGNSMSTTNNITPEYWFRMLCGDGFKYGLIDKLDEGISIFEMYRAILNKLIEYASVSNQEALSTILSNKQKILNTAAIQILSFNMYGIDRPNPIKVDSSPYDLGILDADEVEKTKPKTMDIGYISRLAR